jgi:hypothetical protein
MLSEFEQSHERAPTCVLRRLMARDRREDEDLDA